MFLFSPQTSLAGTWDIGQDEIETVPHGKFLGLVAGNHRIHNPKPGQCMAQWALSRRHQFIRHDKPPVLHQFTDMCGLSSRCRTHVEHPRAWGRVKNHSRKAAGKGLGMNAAKVVFREITGMRNAFEDIKGTITFRNLRGFDPTGTQGR